MRVTIVEGDKDLCKKVVNGSMEGYGRAYLYTPELKEVNNLEELSEVLTALESEPRKAVLRDEPKELKLGRRLKARYNQVKTQWLCLDWDRPAPEGCPDYVVDPVGAIEFMVEREWAFLKGVGVHWQLGNSAGFVSSHFWSLLKMRIFFKRFGWRMVAYSERKIYRIFAASKIRKMAYL